MELKIGVDIVSHASKIRGDSHLGGGRPLFQKLGGGRTSQNISAAFGGGTYILVLVKKVFPWLSDRCHKARRRRKILGFSPSKGVIS